MTVWVLLAGLPGTGKSTLARALARRLGGVHLDKDRVREALFPGPSTDYSRVQDDLCVRAILEAAAYLSAAHAERAPVNFVFLDGRTFSRREQIDEVIHAAQNANAAWRILHVSCDDNVVEARLSKVDSDNPAGNRNLALYRRIKASFELISYPNLDVDTTGGVDAVVEDVLRSLTHPFSS